MSLRKLAAVPLAGSVAVVAHVAGFGFGHAPGGSNSAELFAILAAALLLAATGVFIAAALERPCLIATGVARAKASEVTALTAAGFGCYLLVEMLEGHWALAGSLRALAASLPAAALLAFLARLAAGSICQAGRRFAAFAIAIARRARAFGELRFADLAVVPCAATLPVLRISGRAPPFA